MRPSALRPCPNPPRSDLWSARLPSTCLCWVRLAVCLARSARQRPQPGGPEGPRSALPCDPLGNGLRRHRMAEAKALERMNAGRAQEQMLLGGFHALRRDLHAEPPAEAHDRMDDRRGIGGALDIGDEAAIDLQAVEREGAKIEQARIAGPQALHHPTHAHHPPPPPSHPGALAIP